jgi:hypothetical protein
MDARPALGASLLVALLLAAALRPDRAPPPPAPGCTERELVEVRELAGPPRLACRGTVAVGEAVEAVERRDGRLVEAAPSARVRFLLGRPLDVNRATEADLVALPGIGPSLARRIADDRAGAGPFRSLADLDRVRGIGPSRVRELEGWTVAQDGAPR